MKTKKDYGFGSLRLKKGTLEFLHDMKTAFEAAGGCRMTMDGFVEKLVASVENGDAAVWGMYSRLRAAKDEMAEMAAGSRRNGKE